MGEALPVIILIVLLGGIIASLFFQLVKINRLHQQAALNLEQSHQKEMATRERLDLLLQINQRLVEAADEKELITSLLEILSRLVGASGSTYVPLDSLGQPLASISQGEMLSSPLDPWVQHLGRPEVSDVCEACQKQHSSPGDVCPLMGHPFLPGGQIVCFPIKRNQHRLGMINLYLPPGKSLDPGLEKFLVGLLEEIALAIESLRLRSQELETLRQLHLFRPHTTDLKSLLSRLLDTSMDVLEGNYAAIFIRGTDRHTAFSTVWQKNPVQASGEELTRLIDTVMISGQVAERVRPEAANLIPTMGALLCVPVKAGSSTALGSLIVARHVITPFDPRQVQVAEVVASQAAILVANERSLGELEYQTVVDERSRLAREIHDGLAQSLAFLKLQAAQMRAALSRSDINRLDEILHTSQETLNQAYMDARQSIDHLRLTPQPGVHSWLEQAASDFQSTTHIPVYLSLKMKPDRLPLEIQVQLIRVVQEALSNIRKHAHATQVTISMLEYQGDLILEISDDGSGFPPDEIPVLSQYGLRGMRERAEIIGADFQIISQPNAGTTVRLRLPYHLEGAQV